MSIIPNCKIMHNSMESLSVQIFMQNPVCRRIHPLIVDTVHWTFLRGIIYDPMNLKRKLHVCPIKAFLSSDMCLIEHFEELLRTMMNYSTTKIMPPDAKIRVTLFKISNWLTLLMLGLIAALHLSRLLTSCSKAFN